MRLIIPVHFIKVIGLDNKKPSAMRGLWRWLTVL